MIRLAFLSAALMAAATLTTPVMAKVTHVRHLAARVEDSANNGARYIDGRICIPAPRVGAFATQPWGDKDVPCEPMMGY